MAQALHYVSGMNTTSRYPLCTWQPCTGSVHTDGGDNCGMCSPSWGMWPSCTECVHPESGTPVMLRAKGRAKSAACSRCGTRFAIAHRAMDTISYAALPQTLAREAYVFTTDVHGFEESDAQSPCGLVGMELRAEAGWQTVAVSATGRAFPIGEVITRMRRNEPWFGAV